MKKKILLSLIIVALLAASCTKKISTRRYYIFDIPTVGQKAKPETPLFQLQVDVRNFSVARAFDQTRIALRTDTNEMDYYFYHHWASKPSLAVADFVFDIIENRNVFSSANRSISYNPDYLVQGNIKSIERIESNKMAFAHISMVLEFINADTEQVVAFFEDDQRLPLEPAQSMNTFARACSQILMHMTDEFLKNVTQYLENQPGIARP